jgi:5-methylcytosine-specific restriction endonuclease McrA
VREKGFKHSEETKRKMSFAHKKEKLSKETRQKMSEAQKGKKLSEETRQKTSEARKKENLSEETRRKRSETMKGRKLAVEHRRRISVARKGMKFTREHKRKLREAYDGRWDGELNPNWKGGTTPQNMKIRKSIEFRLWREAVFARDNFTCQKYGVKGCMLHAHHIQNFSQYPELRFAIDNGVTLSEKAHKEFHRKYGRRGNTREQLEEFLSS